MTPEFDDICKLFPKLRLSSSGKSSMGAMLGVKKKKKNINKKKTKKKNSNKKKKKLRRMNEEEIKHNYMMMDDPNKLLGVYRTSKGLFNARITYPDGRRVLLGTFMSSTDATFAYDEQSLKLYSVSKPLNFPRCVLRPVQDNHAAAEPNNN